MNSTLYNEIEKKLNHYSEEEINCVREIIGSYLGSQRKKENNNMEVISWELEININDLIAWYEIDKIMSWVE